MIKGHNIYLRLIEKEDIRILYKICNQEKVRRYSILSNDIKDNNSKESKDLRKALSIINEKNVLIGFVTYKECNYYNNVYSIGITIGSRHWNRGYGQDSIRTLVKYLFEDLNAIKIELEVIKSNLRAINCYKKCGFIEESIKTGKCNIDGEYVDTIIMVLLINQIV